MANKTTIRVELVDNWHARWPAVLQAIASCGQLEALSIDADGWLSARQVLLVACAPDNFVAGHLCFRLVPAADLAGNVEVEAHLQAIGVSEILPAAQAARVAGALTSAARKRARALRCQRLVGFAA
jgi:hypothetical protein